MPKRIKHILIAVFSLIGTLAYSQCNFTGLAPNYCVYSPTVLLSPITTTSGYFSGPGIITTSQGAAVFSPSVAGSGTHVISYGVCSSSYTVTSGTYAPIGSFTSSGSSTTTTGGEGASVSLGDDQVSSSSFPIGFNFQFFCNTYSNFYIGSNGFITFSSSQSQGCCSGQVLPNSASPNNLITLTWTDWDPSAGGSITYTTVGVSPNRKLLVNFIGVPHFFSGNPMTAQLQLHETSNIIEIHTTTMVPNSNGHTMGIEDLTGANAYVVSGRNSTNTWTASTEMYRYTPLPGCVTSQTVVVSPSTVAVTGNTFICTGGTTTLTAFGNSTYSWSTSSNSNSIVVSPTTATQYSVSATNSAGCIASSTLGVVISTVTPTVIAVASSTSSGICPGSTLSLLASGALSYTWSNGVTNGAVFSPTSTSTYVVTGDNGCGTATAAISISIHPIPPVTATASSPTLCAGSLLTLTGGGASSYVWTGGVLNGVAFTPTATASYTVTGTSVLGCTATAVTTATVFTVPNQAPVSSPTLICLGKSATITASGANTYSWFPVASTSSAIVVNPTVTTTYTLVQANSACANTKTITLFVNSPPLVIAIVSPTVICANNTASLAGAGGATYTWTAPNYTTSGATPVVLPGQSTTYTMTASDGTCVNTSTVFLAVNPIPTINIAASASIICSGDVSTITVGGGQNYTWTPIGLSGTNVVVSPTASTLYSVIGDNSFGCTSGASQVMLVNPLPTAAAATNKTLVCVGGAATLHATGSANSYSWSTGVFSSSITVNPTVATVYTVTGITAMGCKQTATVAVNVYDPTVTISGSTVVCPGGSATLAASGASSYTWNGTSPFYQIIVTPSVPTVYSVAAVGHSNTTYCNTSATVQVIIGPNPVITASANRTTICKGEKAILTAQGGSTYYWSNSITGTTTQVGPSSLTIYTVTGTDVNGCSGTATVQVKVLSCTGIEELSGDTDILIYPNPSAGDFMIISKEKLNLQLISELGQVIHTIQLSEGNNHKVEIHDIANGIYFLIGSSKGYNIREKIVVNR